MGWNIQNAVQTLQHNARASSTGHCAKFTVDAIEAGGVSVTRTADAKNLGPSLIGAGFAEISGQGPFDAGDVVVIAGFGTHTHGHAAMFDGKIWISDFRQHALYPGSGYRAAKPKFKVYRHP